MITFVRENQLASQFKRLDEPADGVVIAAPFWGKGATKMLGLAKRRRVRILCTFDALACNPVELAELHKIGAEIRSYARLHAKIYAAGKVVIMGSSNPSRYGLTQEGDMLGGSIEANILTDDKGVVEAATSLIEELWQHDDTVRITPRMVHDEIKRRALLPTPFVRRALKAKTLLAAFREAPELFGSVYVAAYWHDLDDGGKEELRRIKVQAKAPTAGPKSVIFQNAWGYQFEADPPGGAWLIALDCKGAQPKVWGASQVPMPVVVRAIPGENNLYPTIRGVVTVPGAVGSFKISSAEKAQLAAISDKLKRKPDFVPLREAMALIDRLD